jgi:2-dehydropantoate 2-reductase
MNSAPYRDGRFSDAPQRIRFMARIAIIGPGAIGSVVAAWLFHSGQHQIVLCARRPLAALEVETPAGRLTVEPEILTDPPAATPVDWILVTTKAYDDAGAATWFAGLAANGAPVAVLQNGVEHRERFIPFISGERLVPVMVDCPAERLSPSHVRQRGPARMAVADDARGRAFAALFSGTAIEIAVTSDFKCGVAQAVPECGGRHLRTAPATRRHHARRRHR